MHYSEINLDQTHIRLTTDIGSHDLRSFIYSLRSDLKAYIARNQDFLLSIEPILKYEDDLPLIVRMMYESSNCADVGPMACVAGTISQLSLDYLIGHDSKYSIVENGGDIALINDETLLCGIFSTNPILGNDMAFEIKARKGPLGICTSSAKIGHSISFGQADSVTVLSKSASIADGLATRIANDVAGENSEEKVYNALESVESFKDFFDGVLIVADDNVGTVGRLPKIVETSKFDIKL